MLYVYLLLKNFLNWLVSMFFKSKKETQGGELVVSGCHKIKISLDAHPHSVEVRFLDECNVAPCNPLTFDELSYVLTKQHGEQLVIQWDVSSVRTIGWRVVFKY
jgi:hypothetical protein